MDYSSIIQFLNKLESDFRPQHIKFLNIKIWPFFRFLITQNLLSKKEDIFTNTTLSLKKELEPLKKWGTQDPLVVLKKHKKGG